MTAILKAHSKDGDGGYRDMTCDILVLLMDHESIDTGGLQIAFHYQGLCCVMEVYATC